MDRIMDGRLNPLNGRGRIADMNNPETLIEATLSYE